MKTKLLSVLVLLAIVLAALGVTTVYAGNGDIKDRAAAACGVTVSQLGSEMTSRGAKNLNELIQICSGSSRGASNNAPGQVAKDSGVPASQLAPGQVSKDTGVPASQLAPGQVAQNLGTTSSQTNLTTSQTSQTTNLTVSTSSQGTIPGNNGSIKFQNCTNCYVGSLATVTFTGTHFDPGATLVVGIEGYAGTVTVNVADDGTMSGSITFTPTRTKQHQVVTGNKKSPFFVNAALPVSGGCDNWTSPSASSSDLHVSYINGHFTVWAPNGTYHNDVCVNWNISGENFNASGTHTTCPWGNIIGFDVFAPNLHGTYRVTIGQLTTSITIP